MPKATSSRPTSPVKGSPTKRAHRKHPTGSFAVPLGTTASSLPSFPRQVNYKRDQADGQKPSESNVLLLENLDLGSSTDNEKSRAPAGSFWLAEDVFPNTNTPRTASPTSPSPPMSPGYNITNEFEDAMDMADVETALDEAAVTSGLGAEGSSLENTQSLEDASANGKPHLRLHYIPVLLAAKAPTHLPLQCSNYPNCEKHPGDNRDRHFRCTQCFGRRILCTSCLLDSHRHSPFHWPEEWVDKNYVQGRANDYWASSRPNRYGYFKRTSLFDIGLHVGLGHDGELCPKSHKADAIDISVLHTTGQHRTRFRPCACSSKEVWRQLLEADLFPATEKNPQTVFTIEVLRHQRCFNLRSKTNLKEYYDALVDLTSSAETKGRVPVIYDSFRAVNKQHRALTMHIRAGRYDGSAPLENGELCVVCPACPQPGVNLPKDWEQDPLKQLHYVRFLAGDGNFKLQRLSRRSKSAQDSGVDGSLLGDGGFWVPESVFNRYLSETTVAGDEPQGQRKSACNTMAGDPGNSPEGAKVLDVTGIFCVSCRHIFICPNGVVDFHKGEKYRYVDVCFAGPLNASYAAGLRYFVITYDIACKYGVNFKSRCCDKNCKFVLVPTPNGEINVIFCVNKFHQESHDDGCAAKNALNYTKYVGQTCGEGVETVWARMNGLRSSSKEMGAGSRIELLSEHFNDWNWQKLLGITRHLKLSYTKSVEALDVVIRDLDDLKTSIGPQTATELEEGYRAAGGEQFLEDSSRLQWLSRRDLFARMQELDPASTEGLTVAEGFTNVAHVKLICKALKLESMQAKLHQRAHDLAKLPNPTSTLKDRVKALADEVKSSLRTHCGDLLEVAPKLEQLARTTELSTQDEILLPSRLSAEEVAHYGVSDLLSAETPLRVCHAYDIINEVRKALGLQSFWSRYIHAQHSSQTKRTKGRSSFQASCARVRETARAYTVCYEWLKKSSPQTADKFGLQPLRSSDLVLLSSWKDRKGYKRTNVRLPWIWTLRPIQTSDILELAQDDDGEDTIMETEAKALSPLETVVEKWRNEFVRLDFVHTLAATERWTEEVRILSREMPATCRSFRNSAVVWARRGDNRIASVARDSGAVITDTEWSALSPHVRGYVAYASRQFDLYATLATEAMDVFSAVVGESGWQDIWLAPQAKDLVLTEPGAY